MKNIRQLLLTLVIMCLPIPILAQSGMPPHIPIWDGNKVKLELHKLADNVYAVSPSTVEAETSKGIPQATSAGFIVGEKGVLLIETMLNKRLYDQLVSLVKNVTDKPILYAVNTSDHGDHCFGNYLLPKNAIVIQNEFAKQNLAKNYDNIKKFMTGLFGAGRGIEESVYRPADLTLSVNQTMKLDLGNGISVDFVNVGTAQSPADLFVFAISPKKKILWAGNPFIAESPAIPWLFDGYFLEPAKNLRKIYDMVSEDDIIVPGHGRITNKAGIRYTLDYVDALKTNVGSAVKQGLTLEQTKALVKMKEFDKGYQLFDWLHYDFNLPNAYNDIKANQNQKL